MSNRGGLVGQRTSSFGSRVFLFFVLFVNTPDRRFAAAGKRRRASDGLAGCGGSAPAKVESINKSVADE